MIKRILGNLFAVAVVVIVVFTALGAGSYSSMLSEDLFRSEQKSENMESVKTPTAQKPAEKAAENPAQSEAEAANSSVQDDVAAVEQGDSIASGGAESVTTEQ